MNSSRVIAAAADAKVQQLDTLLDGKGLDVMVDELRQLDTSVEQEQAVIDEAVEHSRNALAAKAEASVAGYQAAFERLFDA